MPDVHFDPNYPEGPPQLFGMKINSISSSVGWGGQGGTCQLTLVDAGGTGFPWDDPTGAGRLGNWQPRGLKGSGSQIGITQPAPLKGTAIGFKFRKFEFGGHYQRHSYKESQSGRLYDVTLESPAKLLDGVQVILSGFETGYAESCPPIPGTGPGTGVPAEYEYGVKNVVDRDTFPDFRNVWNLFAEYERFDLATGGPGYFGKSKWDSSGIPAWRLFHYPNAGSSLPSSFSWTIPSIPSGGGSYPGMTEEKYMDDTVNGMLQKFGDGYAQFGQRIKFGQSEYTIDFSALGPYIAARAPEYRIQGTVKSLSALISELAEICQVDYFIDVYYEEHKMRYPKEPIIDPVTGNITGYTHWNGEIGHLSASAEVEYFPRMVVRVCDRATPAVAGVIQTFIDNEKPKGHVVSDNIGEELQDVPTTRMIIGGAASRQFHAPVDNSLTTRSVWSSKGSNSFTYTNIVTPYNPTGCSFLEYDDAFYKVNIYLDEGSSISFNSYTATIFELRMALGGMETWETFKVFQTITREKFGILHVGSEPNGYTFLNAPWMGAIEANYDTFLQLAGGRRDALDMAVSAKKNADIAFQQAAQQENQKIFNAVSKVATNFYGQVFNVQVPKEDGGRQNNIRFFTGDNKAELSWENSESSWADPCTGTFPVHDWAFFDGDGRQKSFAVFPLIATGDYSPLGGEYASAGSGKIATTKGGPDKEIYWPSNEDNPNCIVRTGVQIRDYDYMTTADQGLRVLANLFWGLSIPDDYYRGPGKQSVQIEIPPAVLLPTYIAVPQESTRYTWGPWIGWTADNGKAEVEVDDGLRPETFGSVAAMDDVGFASVFAGLATMDAVESGSVELALEPTWNIGERFNAAGPYVSGLDISVGMDGYKTTYKFSTWTPTFGKLAKYNADRLAKVNKSGIALAKKRRDEVIRRPFPQKKLEKTDFSAKYAQGGLRFANRMGMEVMNGLFRHI